MPVGDIDFPWTGPNPEPSHLPLKPEKGHLETY